MFSLSGKTAIVTGARRGLGQSAARALASAGANIIGVGPNEMDETAALVTELGQAFTYVNADLSTASAAQLNDLIDDLWADHGHIDILANNAGIIRRADLPDYSEQDWNDVMNVNLNSLFWLSQAFGRKLIQDGVGGRIINTASLLTFQGGIRVPAYTASKHAVAGLTKALANELAPHKITANAIAPGYMNTDNTEALRNDPQRSAEILGRIPLGEWGPASALDSTYVYLAADESSYVTGTVAVVDGGWMAR